MDAAFLSLHFWCCVSVLSNEKLSSYIFKFIISSSHRVHLVNDKFRLNWRPWMKTKNIIYTHILSGRTTIRLLYIYILHTALRIVGKRIHNFLITNQINHCKIIRVKYIMFEMNCVLFIRIERHRYESRWIHSILRKLSAWVVTMGEFATDVVSALDIYNELSKRSPFSLTLVHQVIYCSEKK